MSVTYSVADVAAMFGVSDPTVRRWALAHVPIISCTRTSDGKLVFQARDLVELARRQANEARHVVEIDTEELRESQHALSGALARLNRLERLANDENDVQTDPLTIRPLQSFAHIPDSEFIGPTY